MAWTRGVCHLGASRTSVQSCLVRCKFSPSESVYVGLRLVCARCACYLIAGYTSGQLCCLGVNRGDVSSEDVGGLGIDLMCA